MILSPHYIKRHTFAQKVMAQSSTFEMSTPSGIDESCQSEPNETPVCMTYRENDEVMEDAEMSLDTLERQVENLRSEMNRLVQECEEQAEKSKQWLASSCVQDQTCLSSPQFVAKPKSGTPKPPVEYVHGVVSNLSNEFFDLERGDENSAPSIGDIEGARQDNGLWYLYTKKSSTTYLEFEFAILAAVNFLKIREYAYKYKVWGLLEESFVKTHSKV
ncbi:hypothetical protein DICA4_A05490 [Diutina catenulata]